MPTVNGDSVRIGQFDIDLDEAKGWISAYTDAEANRSSTQPYAFPAYDHFEADSNQPAELTDADLLAPALLNVSVGIREYYGLQRVRERLEPLLAAGDLALPLAELDDSRIETLIGGLFGVLDHEAPWGVKGTTLSKVLHRKRPTSIPLHDRWVWVCYVQSGDPVPQARTRTWADYMTLVAQAMARDLREQPNQFAELHSASQASPALSHLRLLDILAWNRGQRVDQVDVPAEDE